MHHLIIQPKSKVYRGYWLLVTSAILIAFIGCNSKRPSQQKEMVPGNYTGELIQTCITGHDRKKREVTITVNIMQDGTVIYDGRHCSYGMEGTKEFPDGGRNMYHIVEIEQPSSDKLIARWEEKFYAPWGEVIMRGTGSVIIEQVSSTSIYIWEMTNSVGLDGTEQTSESEGTIGR